jgi:hypothetical protein
VGCRSCHWLYGMCRSLKLEGQLSRLVEFLKGYSNKLNRVLLVIVFIQKAIAYSYINKIQIYKQESCSIRYIEPCEKMNLTQNQSMIGSNWISKLITSNTQF